MYICIGMYAFVTIITQWAEASLQQFVRTNCVHFFLILGGWLCIGSLKLATAEAFIPWKSAKAVNQGFCFCFARQLVHKHLLVLTVYHKYKVFFEGYTRGQ